MQVINIEAKQTCQRTTKLFIADHRIVYGLYEKAIICFKSRLYE